MNKTLGVIFFSLILLSCSESTDHILNIAGSDTILELIQAQAEAFYGETKIPVNVTGGGTGVGINLVKENSIDIANASRTISPEEEDVQLAQVMIAKDLISVVVSKENPIHELSREQLAGIYTGRIKNWKELGWEDLPISLYGRQSSSGTYQYFQKMILEEKDYSPRVKEMTGNSQVIRALEEDVAGIAYVAFGYYAAEQSALNLVAVGGIAPSPDKNMDHYLLARGVYEVFHKNSEKIQLIHRWFSYILGAPGKREIDSMGFVNLNPVQLLQEKKNAGIS